MGPAKRRHSGFRRVLQVRGGLALGRLRAIAGIVRGSALGSPVPGVSALLPLRDGGLSDYPVEDIR